MFSLFSLAVEFKSYLYITPLPFLITIISTLVLSAKCDVAVVCFCLLFCVYIDTNSSKIDIELFFRPPPPHYITLVVVPMHVSHTLASYSDANYLTRKFDFYIQKDSYLSAFGLDSENMTEEMYYVSIFYIIPIGH